MNQSNKLNLIEENVIESTKQREVLEDDLSINRKKLSSYYSNIPKQDDVAYVPYYKNISTLQGDYETLDIERTSIAFRNKWDKELISNEPPQDVDVVQWEQEKQQALDNYVKAHLLYTLKSEYHKKTLENSHWLMRDFAQPIVDNFIQSRHVHDKGDYGHFLKGLMTPISIVAGATVAPAVGAGATVGAVTGTILAREGILSIGDTFGDSLIYNDKTDKGFDYGKNYALNYAGNLAGEAMGLGVEAISRSAKQIFNKIKLRPDVTVVDVATDSVTDIARDNMTIQARTEAVASANKDYSNTLILDKEDIPVEVIPKETNQLNTKSKTKVKGTETTTIPDNEPTIQSFTTKSDNSVKAKLDNINRKKVSNTIEEPISNVQIEQEFFTKEGATIYSNLKKGNVEMQEYKILLKNHTEDYQREAYTYAKNKMFNFEKSNPDQVLAFINTQEAQKEISQATLRKNSQAQNKATSSIISFATNLYNYFLDESGQLKEGAKSYLQNSKAMAEPVQNIIKTFKYAKEIEYKKMFSIVKHGNGESIKKLEDVVPIFNKNSSSFAHFILNNKLPENLKPNDTKILNTLRIDFLNATNTKVNKLYESDDVFQELKKIFGDDKIDEMFDYYETTSLDENYYVFKDSFELETSIDTADNWLELSDKSLNSVSSVISRKLGLTNEVVRNIIEKSKAYDNKKVTQKNITKAIKDLGYDRAFVLEMLGVDKLNMKDFSRTVTKAISEETENVMRPAKLLQSLIDKESASRNTMLRKAFLYFNKQEALSNVSDISIVTDTETRKRLFFSSQEEAIEHINKIPDTEQRQKSYDRLMKNMKSFKDNILPTSTPLELAKEYYMIPITTAKGQTKHIDITTTTLEDIARMYGLNINSKEYEDQLNKLGSEITSRLIENVGKHMFDTLKNTDGTSMSIKQITDYYLLKYKLHDKLTVSFETVEKGTGGYFSVENGQAKIVISDVFKDTNTQLGILRHELQHAIEFFRRDLDTPFGMIARTTMNFRNIPGVNLKEFAGKDKVLLDVVNSYYDRHFYNFSTGSFESSYVGWKFAQAFEQLDDFGKYSFFMKGLYNSRSTVIDGHLNTYDLLKNYTQNQQVEVLEDFISNQFKDTDSLYNFLDVLTEQNRALDFHTLLTGIVNKKATKETGVDLNAMLRLFSNKSRMVDYATQRGYNLNDYTFKLLNSAGLRLSQELSTDGFSKDLGTKSNIATTLLARALIGYKPLKEGVSTLVGNNLLLGSDKQYKAMLDYTIQAVPQMIKSTAISWYDIVPDVIKSSGIALKEIDNIKNYKKYNKLMETATTEELKKIQDEMMKNNFLKTSSNILMSVADNLYKAIPNDEFQNARLLTEQLKNLALDNMIYRSGSNPDSLVASLYRTNIISSIGSMQDNLASALITRNFATLKLNNIMSVKDFSELSKFELSVLNQMGYTEENWKNFIISNYDDWHSAGFKFEKVLDNPELQNFLSIASSKSDLLGTSEISMDKNAMTQFNFMTNTIKNMSMILADRFLIKKINGMSVGRKNLFDWSEQLITAFGVAGLGAGIVYSKDLVLGDLLHDKDIMETAEKDIDNLVKGKMRNNGIMDSIRDVAPGVSLVTGSSAGTPLSVGLSVAQQEENIFDLAFRVVLGSVYSTFKKMFQEDPKTEKENNKKLEKAIKTRNFQKIVFSDNQFLKTVSQLSTAKKTIYVNNIDTAFAYGLIDKSERDFLLS